MNITHLYPYYFQLRCVGDFIHKIITKMAVRKKSPDADSRSNHLCPAAASNKAMDKIDPKKILSGILR